MSLVIDASVAAVWLFQDERADLAARALTALESEPGIAPAIWSYEMRNLLLVAARRGRIDAQGADARLAALADLPIAIEPDADLDAAVALARAHDLSFYDALYLELARRRGAALATLDAKLRAAAASEGVSFN